VDGAAIGIDVRHEVLLPGAVAASEAKQSIGMTQILERFVASDSAMTRRIIEFSGLACVAPIPEMPSNPRDAKQSQRYQAMASHAPPEAVSDIRQQ
jgi:hypothetical protein